MVDYLRSALAAIPESSGRDSCYAQLSGEALIGLAGAVLTKDEEQAFREVDRGLMLVHFRCAACAASAPTAIRRALFFFHGRGRRRAGRACVWPGGGARVWQALLEAPANGDARREAGLVRRAAGRTWSVRRCFARRRVEKCGVASALARQL